MRRSVSWQFVLALGFVAVANCQMPSVLYTDIDQIDAGGPTFTTNVTGAGFVSGSVGYWATTPLETVYVATNQLVIRIPASLIAISGKYPITIRNSNGAISNACSMYVQPVLNSLFPTGTAAGVQSATIVASGVGFTPYDALWMQGAYGGQLTTTYVNSTTLSAVVPAAALAKSAQASVNVTDVLAGVFSRQLTYTIGVPPILKSLVPASAVMGGAGFTMTINGSGFVSGASAFFNGRAIPTVFNSATQLTASIDASLLTLPGATPGLPFIWVTNPDAGLSNSVRFTVNPPTPVISSLNPASVFAAGPSFTLTVNGTGFYTHSVVWFSGAPVPTTFISSTQLTATIPATSIAAAATGDVYVFNTGFEAPNAASDYVRFPITPPNLSSLTPSSLKAGSPGFTLTANGAGFLPAAAIQWNGSPLVTTYVSPTQLSTPVNAGLIATPGKIAVTVVNPGGAVSSPVNFAVDPLAPRVSEVSPNSVIAGGATFTVIVRGVNFVTDAVVQWNGAALVTAYVTDTQLTATVPAALIAAPAAAAISVVTRGGLSNPVAVMVTAPAPSADSGGVVNAASSSPSVAPGSLITIYGANLATGTALSEAFPLSTALKGTSISINGSAAPLLYVSPKQINAQVPFEVQPGRATLVISVNGAKSASIAVPVTATGPGTLMVPQTNHALAQNFPDGSLNSPDAPAVTGQYVTAYLTGQGILDNPVATGAPAPVSPLSTPIAPVQARVGGQPAEILFAGMVPGFAGLMQVNLKIPAVAPGEQIFELTIGGVSANPTTLSIGSPQ